MSDRNSLSCAVCPRQCDKPPGFCGGFGADDAGAATAAVAKTMLHMWEEPPISGTRGSGAVFFAGCNLRCVFCQNQAISRNLSGEERTAADLVGVFFRLAEEGAHNINLITAAHFTPIVADAIRQAKEKGFALPFIWNSSGYERVDSLKMLDGLVDVYLPDFKYFNDDYAVRYSHAPGYAAVAQAAIEEMRRQTGGCVFDSNGLIQKGTMVRCLLLPGLRKDCMDVLSWLAEHVPDVKISMLRQYTPCLTEQGKRDFPEINRTVTTFEYDSVVRHCVKLGLEGYLQAKGAASGEFIPEFCS
jgi:putative pyruvate formate lyase activating enzyme